jgi:hypothetical protein
VNVPNTDLIATRRNAVESEPTLRIGLAFRVRAAASAGGRHEHDPGIRQRISGFSLKDDSGERTKIHGWYHGRNPDDSSEWRHWCGIAHGSRKHRVERRSRLPRARDGCEEGRTRNQHVPTAHENKQRTSM